MVLIHWQGLLNFNDIYETSLIKFLFTWATWFYLFLLVSRLLMYCDVNEKNTILRQELSKLKVNSEDRFIFSELFQTVAFSNLNINVFSEKFRMNLAFTIALTIFILSNINIGGDIFCFRQDCIEE